MNNTHYTHASFWKRILAGVIDGVIFFIAYTCISFVVSFMYVSVFRTTHGVLTLGFVLFIGSAWLYFVVSEASSRGATFGKRLFSIRVVSKEYAPASYRALSIRFVLRCTALILGGIPYWYAVITRKKTLYIDTYSKTQCVHTLN